MAASSLIPGVVQKFAQNVLAASKVATASTTKALAGLKPGVSSPASPKQSKSDELANLLENGPDEGGFSSFVAAGSVDATLQNTRKISSSSSAQTKEVAKKAAELTKHKLLQIQKGVIADRASHLSDLLRQSQSIQASVTVCDDIASDLANHPEAVEFYSKHNIIPLLLRTVQRGESVSDDRLRHMAAARRCLALLGYTFPVKGPGVSILSLDGGGMKGLALIEVLKQLEKTIGRPLHTSNCFDYVMGSSTGGIVALVVFMLKTSLDECEKMYLDLGTQMFSRKAVVGTSQLLLTQAFYDSQLWEEILKNRMEGGTFLDFAGDPTIPKVSVLSSVADDSSYLRPFLFRNYNPPYITGAQSSPYPLLAGSARYKLWQGCRASSAAPFYYDEFKLDGHVYIDGGLIANNPTAYALHEASLLWPNEQTNCVVSVGTGRVAEAWLPMVPSNINNSSSKASMKQQNDQDIGKKSLNELAKSPSLRQKIVQIVQAASDTEVTHSILSATLPKDRYFRLNPFLSEQVSLDECRPESLAKLQADAQRYAELNELKFRSAAKHVLNTRTRSRRVLDSAKIRFVASTPLISSSFSSVIAKTNGFKSNMKQRSLLLSAPVRKWLNF